MYGQYNNPYTPNQDNLAYLRSQQPPQQPLNPIIYVQGEEAAKSYLVARNNTVVLWDTEKPCIYIKSADNNGIPNMRVFDIKERTTAPATPTSDYVTKEELNDILKGYLAKPTPKTKEVKADD